MTATSIDPPSSASCDETQAVLDRWRCELSLIVRDAPQGAVARLLRDEVFRMETAISRFREDSELSIANRQAGAWTSVSWYFVDVLRASLEAADLTDGIVDPCLAQHVDAAGYREWRDGAQTQTVGTDPAPPTDPSAWQDIEIRPAGSHALVRLPKGVQLDLGAIAKGWLADRLAHRSVAELGGDVVANMGGDIRAIARTRPWTLTADPEHDSTEEADLEVWDAGLATSGVGKRAWSRTDGGRAHHIIDPRTGRPAVTPWWSCSVLAESAAAANAASTAGMVLGAQGPQWVEANGLDAWFVSETATDHRLVGRW